MGIVAWNMRRLMKEQGIEKGWLAWRLGFTEDELLNTLLGKKRILAVDIPKIARALRVLPSELFESEDFTG